MGKQVFAVTRGEYSDYRVSAMFSTREKAQAYIDAIKDGGFNEICPFDLDPPTSDLIKRGYTVWSVSMDRDGNVRRCQTDLDAYGVESADEANASLWGAVGEKQTLTVSVWAKTAEAAIKIVNEKRAVKIASGEWDVIRRK